jgi:NAD(P)-dependent dehydrogenase (short-subunit alcohol dehydrogenase family)
VDTSLVLAGRRAIVTGAARGIGAEVVRGLVRSGARVLGLDVRDELGREVAVRLGDDRCRFMHCDVSSRSEVEAAVASAVDWFGGLDVLVNAAGLDKPGFLAEDIPDAAYDLVMNVDMRGTFLTNQAACHAMKTCGASGAIINFGSVAGVRGMPDRAIYSAAKAAVQGWTRAVAQAWGKYDITVNAIAPVAATEVAWRYIERLPEEERRKMDEERARITPMGNRMGDIEQDLVPMILLLAGPGGRYITGQTLAIDGGRVMMGA